jgi:ABC-2 type transport system ATP-binding protein
MSKPPFIGIKNIEKHFGAFKALKGVSLDLHEGEIVSLLGANGAGKTTLSSIIATLHPPTAGDVTHNGVSIYSDVTAFRRIIGYCPQKPNLNGMLTLRENLIYAGRYFSMSEKAIKERIAELDQQLSLDKFLDADASTLSGGYKQRFSIARSLMHSPKLVIFDEPTVALDPHIRNQLWEQIKILKQHGATVLLTTHYLDEAEVLSDRVCVLDKGLIRLIDTPQNLMTSFAKNNLEDVFLHLMSETNE